MLQPCNIFIVLISYLSFSRSVLAVQCFNFYLHMQWGSWQVCRAMHTGPSCAREGTGGGSPSSRCHPAVAIATGSIVDCVPRHRAALCSIPC